MKPKILGQNEQVNNIITADMLDGGGSIAMTSGAGSGSPYSGIVKELWDVAKPYVPKLFELTTQYLQLRNLNDAKQMQKPAQEEYTPGGLCDTSVLLEDGRRY